MGLIPRSKPHGTACVLYWSERADEDTVYNYYAFADENHRVIGQTYHGGWNAASILAQRCGSFTVQGKPGELNS